MNERPLVAHVSALPATRRGSVVGGVGSYTLSLLQLLSRVCGASVLIANADADLTIQRDVPQNVRLHPCWHFNSPRYPIDIARALHRNRCDIVHLQHELFLYGQGPRAFLFPLFLRWLTRRYRVVVTVHGVTTTRDIDRELLQGRRSLVPLSILKRLIASIFAATATSAADFVVHTPELRNRLIELGSKPERTHVIAHQLFTRIAEPATLGRAQCRSALGIEPSAKVVLTWGYWNGYKGLDVLVAGVERFRQSEPDAVLVLGTGPHPQLHDDPTYMAAYTAAMERYAAHEHVKVVGFIRDEELPTYVRAADVAMFSYTKHLAASGPATLALSLNTPVLYSDVFSDTPPELTFPPTAAGVSEALTRYFGDPASLEAACRAFRAQATDEVIAASYETLYGKVLGMIPRSERA